VRRPLNFVVIATLSIFLVLRLAAIVVNGFSWYHVIWAHVYLLGLIIAFTWEFKARPGAPDAPPDPAFEVNTPPAEPPLVSLVLLIARPEVLMLESLRIRLTALLGDRLTRCDQAEADVTVVQIDGQYFRVLNSDAPYVKDRQTEAVNAATPEIGQAIRTHEAWRSVDLLDESPDEAARTKARESIATALLALAEDVEPLAIFSPETGRMTLWRDDLTTNLQTTAGVERLVRG